MQTYSRMCWILLLAVQLRSGDPARERALMFALRGTCCGRPTS
jgi:hypothetical protein